jgi:class 3 adenylate cyclase
VGLEGKLLPTKRTLSDDTVVEIHMLAARLRQDLGELDDEAIQAISEATGAPEDYVRLAVRSAPIEDRTTFIDRMKGSFTAFDPTLRRITIAAVLAAGCGLANAVAGATRDSSGLFGALALIAGIGALWNCAVSKDLRVALLSGGLFGSISFVVMALFTFLFGLLPQVHLRGPHPNFLILTTVLGAMGGAAVHALFTANRKKLGFRDPTSERQELLHQLQEIQEKLKSDERFVTFMSLDIVGSTGLKAESDPLTVEFTFSEYQKFVQSVVERHGGTVHSTAGDGTTCVFENPQMAYIAGRALLAGLFEFNSFRNRLVRPLEVRVGVHTGNAHIPGQSLTSVSFAHVIDVAAHMQKAASPGAMMVSETTVVPRVSMPPVIAPIDALPKPSEVAGL